MEHLFNPHYLQSPSGWHEREFSLTDRRHFQRIRDLHQLTLEWCGTPPDISLLKIPVRPSRLRRPAGEALELIAHGDLARIQARLLDERDTRDCLQRMHQLAWETQLLTCQSRQPARDLSLSAGRKASDSFFESLGLTPHDRQSLQADELAPYLSSMQGWIGGAPEADLPEHPSLLLRRVSPLQIDLEVLHLPSQREEFALQEHHLAWLDGWIRSATGDRYRLEITDRVTRRQGRILKVTNP
jgi:hypothetical protein